METAHPNNALKTAAKDAQPSGSAFTLATFFPAYIKTGDALLSVNPLPPPIISVAAFLFEGSWTLAAGQGFMRRGVDLESFAAFGQTQTQARPTMDILLHAQPYDISASGFYFQSADDYAAKAKCNCNDDGASNDYGAPVEEYGAPVEEYEIQFINGDDMDCALAKAWGLHQGNFAAFFEAVEDWDDDQKRRFIIAIGEAGYSFDPETDSPDGFDIDIYEIDSFKELAEQFIDDGLFGDIPERLQFYIDYEAIARNLHIGRKRESGKSEEPSCGGVHVAISLKFNHLINGFVHLKTVDQ